MTKMYLKNIRLIMDANMGDKQYCSHFNYHVFVIGYFLSQHLKKIKFETDGTFDSICVVVGKDNISGSILMRTLTVGVKFDSIKYDRMNESSRNEYYLDLMKRGINLIAEKKMIPYAELNNLMKLLANNRLLYKWTFKYLTLLERNIRAKFTCQLSPNDYTLSAEIVREDSGLLIGSGVVVRTKPDAIFFSHLSRKIYLANDKITITSTWGIPLIHLELSDIINGFVLPYDCESPYPDDKQATQNFKRILHELHYDNENFI